jgi:hypothetical protein
VDGMSIRQAAREFGLSRKTTRKMLAYSVPPGYARKQPIRRPKLGPWLGIIDQILQEDQSQPKKQRHTGMRIWERSGSEVIARHARSYEREEMIFDPLHYLALLEQKTNALDQAAPLQGWQLPKEFKEVRRQIEARLGKRGRREYVQVLRLLQTFSFSEVTSAIQHALRLHAIAFDAFKYLLLCAVEQRPPKLDLENYPHLPVAEVALTRANDYQVPLMGGAR